MVWCDLAFPKTIFCKKKQRGNSVTSCVMSLLAFMQIVQTPDLTESLQGVLNFCCISNMTYHHEYTSLLR